MPQVSKLFRDVAQKVAELVNRDVHKARGGAETAFRVTVAAGGATVPLGPHGCGKTTALRVAVGFDRPTQGTSGSRNRLLAGSNVPVSPKG